MLIRIIQLVLYGKHTDAEEFHNVFVVQQCCRCNDWGWICHNDSEEPFPGGVQRQTSKSLRPVRQTVLIRPISATAFNERQKFCDGPRSGGVTTPFHAPSPKLATTASCTALKAETLQQGRGVRRLFCGAFHATMSAMEVS
ncbi:hypothetical protein Y032_0064g3537 [Ancylostoma ceylanicum]|nr:hypothetical protein Y032_0064g3537 [Ancylostoma ceylanicum]